MFVRLELCKRVQGDTNRHTGGRFPDIRIVGLLLAGDIIL